ncbi:GmrSD restriction endonuclease domain-containing protein [Nocardia sp. NPDC055321]
MKASETTLAALVQGEKQFQIPLYQRTYSWTDKQLAQLWSDICEQADLLAAGEEGTTHFCGSVVLAPSPLNDASFARWLVVDGQQRLTTLSLALAAIRDHYTDPRQRERINEQYLINKFQEDDGYFRILPTQADRPAYSEHVRNTHAGTGGDRIGSAYRYFRQVLIALDDPAEPREVSHIEKAITTRLTLVQVVADRDDNVHRIFESLNNTGLKLSQADLVRNYLFMRLPKRGEQVYQTYWLPMQRSLSNEQLEQLMWLQLVLDGGVRVRRQDMYSAQQRRFLRDGESEEDIEAYVRELHRKAMHFRRIIDPEHEANLEVRRYLRRIDQWQAATTHPVLMMLLDKRDTGVISSDELVMALSYIESFLVRRMICQRPTQSLSGIFQELPGQLPDGMTVVEGLRHVLSAPRRYWATDDELREAIATKPFYWYGKWEQRRLVLQRLEESYEHPEPVDFVNAKLTIEHVLPQEPGPEWLAALEVGAADGESPRDRHGRLVHTLGNLTLTAENSRLSNHPFERKQDLLANSHLEMNRRIAATATWGAAEIAARAAELADRAITLWPSPIGGVERVEKTRDWSLLRRALSVLPPGTWTSYGDLAALVGSSPIAIGQQMTRVYPNAHRVLDHAGRVAEGFNWGDGPDRGDVVDVLRTEGITVNDRNVAAPGQRLNVRDLADLLGMTEADASAAVRPGTASEVDRRARFFAQFADKNPAPVAEAVTKVLAFWESQGGHLEYGTGAKSTSCILMLNRDSAGPIWPGAFYPGDGGPGKLEIVFQHLVVREPFTGNELRNEFRLRLNEIAGVDIPEGKLALRPTFSIKSLKDPAEYRRLCDALLWFRNTALGGETAGGGGWDAETQPVSPAVRALLAALSEHGAPEPEMCVELGRHNWPVEAVWPEWRLALVEGEDDDRDSGLAEGGYRVVGVENTKPDDLAALLIGPRSA